MKRIRRNNDTTNLGGVEELDKALKREKAEVSPPESEERKPHDDLFSHRTAGSLDHPRGSIELKHLSRQVRGTVQRATQSMPGYDTDIVQALADAAAAQATADGKIITFYQDEPPTAEAVGDLWIDTNDGNKLYRWSGAAWIEVQDDDIAQAIADAADAQSTADGKIVTFYQNDIPTSLDIGDLWVDTNDKNKLYRAACVGADEVTPGEWEVARDTDVAQAIADAAAAQATADGKIVTFYQDAIPTSTDIGDLWIDTDDGNKLYRAESIGADEIAAGEWVEVQDTDIAQAISDAADAQSTADNKIVTFYQDGIPTSTDVGDLWVDTNDGNKLYRAACIGANEITAGEWEAARDVHAGRGKIIVAASGYQGNDELFQCDGTADQVQLQAAIDLLDSDYGGGTVEMTEGIFITSGVINLKSNIELRGRGWRSIIKKNGNFYGISVPGSLGSEIVNVALSNFKIIKDDTDVYSQDLIHANYVINITMKDVWCYKPKRSGAQIFNCENIVIQNCIFSNSISHKGLLISISSANPTMAKVIGCMFNNNDLTGLEIDDANYSIFSGNTSRDNGVGISIIGGVYCSIVGNVCENNVQAGIRLADNNSDDNLVIGNVCEGNATGISIAATCDRNSIIGNKSRGNTPDLLDYGVDTHLSGNSWQQPVSGEPSGGTWHKFLNPSTGWFASKTSGWTIDSFSGGLEVDFSSIVQVGTKAVRCLVIQLTAHGGIYQRKSGDTNISNTPSTSFEYSHRLLGVADQEVQGVVWLSSDYKAQFAVDDGNVNLYISYPVEYMI